MPLPYPQNSVPTSLPILDIIRQRWSPLAFSDEPIEQEKIDLLFEAMRWAPSSFNEQPWRIVYATKDQPEDFERLASLLNEDNNWAKNAYMLLFIACVPTFARNQKHNRNAEYDTGAAIEHLFLQAVALGLVGHEMAGFDAEEGMKVLNMPTDWKPLAMMAVGYPGDSNSLPPDLQQREAGNRSRKPATDVVHRGMWDQSGY